MIRFSNLNAIRNRQFISKSIFARAKHGRKHNKAIGKEGSGTTTEDKNGIDAALNPSFLDQIPYCCGNNTKKREGCEAEQAISHNGEKTPTRNCRYREAGKQKEEKECW